MDLSLFKNKTVLIKPNVGRIVQKGLGIITDPKVVAATIDAFTDSGAKVEVGESPIVGVDTLEAFEAAGITEIAKKRNCKLIDLNKGKYVKLPVPGGQAVTSLKVCPKVLEYDRIVSIPVMKTHMHTGVSLSIKNMKGCLWRRSKVDLHMLPPVEGNNEKPLNIAIADMSGILRPHMAIIDGTTGMEGLGPSAGNPKKLGVMVAGFDPFATDAVACSLMGIHASDVPHLSIGSARGYGIIDTTKITITPDNWRDWVSPFKLPPEDLTLEFPNIKVYSEKSCSACQSTLFLLLKRYRKKIIEHNQHDDIIRFAIGKGNEDLPEHTFCIGNCTKPYADKGIFIKGCPPVESEIMTKITGKTTVDIFDVSPKCDRKKLGSKKSDFRN